MFLISFFLCSYIKNRVSNLIPANVTDVFTQGRAWASAMLPVAGLKHSCVITTIESKLRLLVASSDGFVYVYQISTEEGGECSLIKKHDLRNISNTPPPKPYGKDCSIREVYSQCSLSPLPL